MDPSQPAPQLCDLDDHLLLQCFAHLTPLPDLFNVAAACRRFRDLALDRRTWLYVTHSAPPAAAGGLSSPPQRRTPRQERPHQPPPARAPSSASLGGLARSTSAVAVDDSPHWYRQQFRTLAEAVAASRPGDTILLEAGPEPHAIAAPVVVRHPVHILGGGSEVGDCVLAGAKGIEALIEFRASGRLANLTLRATASACVAHTKGRLTVQGCTLECDARGLPHLAAPLLTRAVSRPPPPPTPVAWAERPGPSSQASAAAAAGVAAMAALPTPAAGEKRSAAAAAGWGSAKEEPPASKRLRVWRSVAEAAAGAGVLTVVETRIRARGAAVDLRGSGRLSSVRAIYSTGHALVWLEVDSANSQPASAANSQPASARGSEAAAAVAAAGGEVAPAALPGTPAPSWLSKPFDAAAFQARVAALAGGGQSAGAEQAAAGALGLKGPGAMERKAEEWCVHHHTSLTPAQPATERQPAA